MQKPKGGGKRLVQIPGGALGGWLWMKLIPALWLKKQNFSYLLKVSKQIHINGFGKWVNVPVKELFNYIDEKN